MIRSTKTISPEDPQTMISMTRDRTAAVGLAQVRASFERIENVVKVPEVTRVTPEELEQLLGSDTFRLTLPVALDLPGFEKLAEHEDYDKFMDPFLLKMNLHPEVLGFVSEKGVLPLSRREFDARNLMPNIIRKGILSPSSPVNDYEGREAYREVDRRCKACFYRNGLSETAKLDNSENSKLKSIRQFMTFAEEAELILNRIEVPDFNLESLILNNAKSEIDMATGILDNPTAVAAINNLFLRAKYLNKRKFQFPQECIIQPNQLIFDSKQIIGGYALILAEARRRKEAWSYMADPENWRLSEVLNAQLDHYTRLKIEKPFPTGYPQVLTGKNNAKKR